jgi:hypothetical protein
MLRRCITKTKTKSETLKPAASPTVQGIINVNMFRIHSYQVLSLSASPSKSAQALLARSINHRSACVRQGCQQTAWSNLVLSFEVQHWPFCF